jgi:hypothetical protein
MCSLPPLNTEIDSLHPSRYCDFNISNLARWQGEGDHERLPLEAV